MLDETLAQRYAEALFKLSVDQGRVQDQLADLEVVQEALAGHDPLRAALTSPAIPGQVKKQIASELFGGRVHQDTLHFLYLVIDKQRERYLGPMVTSFQRMVHAREGVVEARIQVASPLDAATRERVVERVTRMTGKRVILKEEVRPELIAGAVLTVGDHLFDGSFESQLRELGERLARA